MRPSSLQRFGSLLLKNARNPASAQVRELSSTLTRVDDNFLKLTIPKNISEEFYDKVEKYYTGLPGNLKPFSEKEFYQCSDELEEVIRRNDPSFLDTLAEVRGNDPFLTLTSGIKVPEISKAELPRTIPDFINNKDLQKTIRLAEASAAAYSHLLGFKPDDYLQGIVTGCMFATDVDKEKTGNYRSSADLGWHNDSWRTGDIMPKISLLGIIGSKEAETQFIPSSKIIDHFLTNGKGHLLESLCRYCYVEGATDDYLEPQVKILDKDGKICFAEYGTFRNGDANFKEAITFLAQSLHEIEPYKVTLGEGDLSIWNNPDGLHKRVNPNPSTKANLVQERLVVRMLGDRADDKER